LVIGSIAIAIAKPALSASRFIRGIWCWVTAIRVDAVEVAVGAGIGWAVEAGTRAAISPIKAAGRHVQCRIAPPVAYVGDGAVGAALELGSSTSKAQQRTSKDDRDSALSHGKANDNEAARWHGDGEEAGW